MKSECILGACRDSAAGKMVDLHVDDLCLAFDSL